MELLILVRHGMPAFGPEKPPREWTLSESGRAGAAALAELLPDGAVLAASTEPKAFQTLEPAGRVLRDERFDEVRRLREPWGGNWRRLRLAFVEGVDHEGWEPRREVAARFDAAVADHLEKAGGRPLVVASHGMAMTVWLTARVGLAEPGVFWLDLRFADPHLVDLEAGTVTRLEGRNGGRSAPVRNGGGYGSG